MARTTKFELEQLLAARNADLEALRHTLSVKDFEIDSLKRQVTALQDAATTTPKRWTRPAWMEAARTQAMTSGKTVRAVAQ